jgi:hypothetical protein
MKKAKEGDVVRLLEYPEGHINEEAKVKTIYPDKSVWIANTNMPFMGTISDIVSKERFERMTGLTV